MHDGSLATLEDVIWHYNTGGRSESGERIGYPAAQIKPLELSAHEISDLVAFLETLTGAPLPTGVTKAPPAR
jgi:cytochrome c peroxidase